MTWLPQRHKLRLGLAHVDVKAVIARWVQETQSAIKQWCFMRLAAAVQHAHKQCRYRDLRNEQCIQKLKAAITSAWRAYAFECKFNRAHLRRKLNFDLKQSCTQFFLLWSQVVRAARAFQSRAAAKHRFNLLRGHMHCWCHHVRCRLSFVAADNHRMAASRLRRLSCIIRHWSAYTKVVIVRTTCARRLASISRRLLLRRSFCFWLRWCRQWHLLKLKRQVVVRDKAAAKSAVCVARFWTKSYVLQCFRSWAALMQGNLSRNRSVFTRTAAKRWHHLFRAWLNVTVYCRKRRWSCSLLVMRYKHHLRRRVYHAWMVSARRAAHARMWLEALCVRWRDGFLMRKIHSLITQWHSYCRSCRLSRIALQRAQKRLLTHSNAFMRRVLNIWRSFKNAMALQQHRSKAGQHLLQKKIQAFMSSLLDQWLQHSVQRRQMRILRRGLNRACDRMLQCKNHDNMLSNFTKWRRLAVKCRVRLACCVRVELIVQVSCHFMTGVSRTLTLVQNQRHSMSRSFRSWSDCVFRLLFCGLLLCLVMFHLIIQTSSRERNAVWLLDKARKANTRMAAVAIPETLWNTR